MKSYFVFLLILSGGFLNSLTAQIQMNLDSLAEVIDQAKPDTNKVRSMNLLAFQIVEDAAKQAQQLAEKALTLADSLGDLSGQANSYYVIGFAQYQMGDLVQADKMAQKAISYAKEINLQDLLKNAYNLMGLLYLYKGQFNDGQEYLEKSIELALKIGDSIGVARNYMHMGTLNIQRRTYEKAETFFSKAKEIVELLDNEELLLKLRLNTGSLYMKQGHIDKAMSNYLTFFQEVDTNTLSMNLAQAYAAMGLIFDAKENGVQALHYLGKAVATFRALGNRQFAAGYLGEMGRVHYMMGNSRKAIPFLEEAIDVSLEIQNYHFVASIYEILGVVQLDLQNYDKALESFTNALDIIPEKNDTAFLVILYSQIGSVYDAQEDYREGLIWMKKSLELLNGLDNPEPLLTINYNIGHVHFWLEEYETAYPYFLECIDILEDLYDSRVGESSRQKVLIDGIDTYEKAVAIAIYTNRVEDAFRFSEQMRSRMLNDMLAEADLSPSLSPTLEQEKQDIHHEIQQLQQALTQAEDAATQQGLTNQLQIATNRLRIFQADIKESNPRRGEILYPEPAGISDIQSVLNKDETLIQFVAGIDITAAVIVSSQEVHTVVLDTNWQVNKAIRLFREDFVGGNKERILENPNVEDNNRRFFFQRASKLYQLLWKPIEDKGIVKNKKLIIIPDRRLAYVPFELLVSDTSMQAFEDYEYLIKAYEISYYPSATTLYLQRSQVEKERQYAQQLLAFGNPSLESLDGRMPSKDPTAQPRTKNELQPLIHSEKEVQNMGKQFASDQAVICTKDHASEDTLLALDLPDFRYIHFSTHGVINAAQPELSHLILSLAKTPDNDGRLYLYEIFDLDLDADLVSLSACDTGLGKLVEGEGLVGFTRGFMYAGTPSLLLSLWAVNEESTSLIFSDYYKMLAKTKGRNKYSPLRKAQLKMIKQGGKFANPYYWAPFVFIGDR
ncbi:MAG: CHAT domain-containing protein [Bacteroidota bacterium]